MTNPTPGAGGRRSWPTWRELEERHDDRTVKSCPLLGHDWGSWTVRGNTEVCSRTCQRENCSAIDARFDGGAL